MDLEDMLNEINQIEKDKFKYTVISHMESKGKTKLIEKERRLVVTRGTEG